MNQPIIPNGVRVILAVNTCGSIHELPYPYVALIVVCNHIPGTGGHGDASINVGDRKYDPAQGVNATSGMSG